MTFSLSAGLGEKLGPSLEAIAVQQLAMAQSLFDSTSIEHSPDLVHSARKACKRARALVRLSQFVIGKRKSRSLTAQIGQLARVLSALRDEQMLHERLRRKLDRLADRLCAAHDLSVLSLRLHSDSRIPSDVVSLFEKELTQQRARLYLDAMQQAAKLAGKKCRRVVYRVGQMLRQGCDG